MSTYTQRIAILTPLKDATPHLERYFECIHALSYPRDLISLGFLESDSVDGTFEAVSLGLPELRREFRSAGLWKRDFHYRLPDGVPRWSYGHQAKRRSILARSRNFLAAQALGDADWALWLDVDVIEYPADIVQHLLATGKEIVHPNCVKEFGGKSFDRNAWKDQDRYHMHDLRSWGELVELDSVGGTMLLIRADLHREGLVFPPFYYGRLHARARRRGAGMLAWLPRVVGYAVRGEIETEGLALMARDMGVSCWGMPNLEIRHKDA